MIARSLPRASGARLTSALRTLRTGFPRTAVLSLVLGVVSIAVGGADVSAASSDGSKSSFVIRAGRIITARAEAPFAIERGIIVVRDGKIVAIGADVKIPDDLPVLDYPDATVMPGLVAAATELAGSHTGDESMAAGYHAIDAFNSYGDYRAALAAGVTTVHLNPGRHRLITGQGAVVKLGGSPSRRVLLERSDLTLNLGDGAFGPPKDVTYRTPASSDVAIPPAVRQRPASRLGQFLALEEVLSAALDGSDTTFSIHRPALAGAWRDETPLRFQAQRGADMSGALKFLARHERGGYLVGGIEADRVAADLRDADVALVYRMPEPLRAIGSDVDHDPNAPEPDVSILAKLDGVELALAGAVGQPIADLRLAAATALRGGLSARRVVEAITSAPAKMLGVSDRVGSLAVGLDADLIVLTGDPLATSTHVMRTYIGGELVFEAPGSGALVVRAGTIWVNKDLRIDRGAILIEDGRVTAVGHSVPHPPFARFIDAGDDAFVTPGWIDARGHLGLDGDDGGTPGPNLSLSTVVGAGDVTGRRVAKAGVTTVLLSPYRDSPMGSQITAVKTVGRDRKQRIVRRTTGVSFDFRKSDPMEIATRLKSRLDAGKKYREKWLKYEKELKEWRDKQAKGEQVETGPKIEDTEEDEDAVDPITGTWAVTISGGPIPEPQTATMKLRLSGGVNIEGRIIVPGAPEEAKVVATLDGKHISGEIEIDTGGLGYPTIEADIVEEDHIVGIISFQGLEIDIDAKRTDKDAVEFQVVRRRTRGKGGRPLPPKVDEGLEPLRAMLDQKLPAVVAVRTAPQIRAVLDTLGPFDVRIVLVGADEASAFSGELAEKSVGVIVEPPIVRRRNHRAYHEADDLARKGVAIAFQSGAEDGARTLPLLGLFAVERGLSPDAALAAFTTDPSRMFGLDGEVGSLDVGAHGDLVIFSGHPFAAGSRVQRVIISGEEVR